MEDRGLIYAPIVLYEEKPDNVVYRSSFRCSINRPPFRDFASSANTICLQAYQFPGLDIRSTSLLHE